MPVAPGPARSEYFRDRKRGHVAARVGLSQAQVAALKVAQGGACGICGTVGDLVIDHCHDTNAFRGLLCLKCNSGIGFLRDDYELCLLAMAYLLRFDRNVKRKAVA